MVEDSFATINKIVKAFKSYIPLRIPTTLKCSCLVSTSDETRVYFGTKQGRIGIVDRDSEEVVQVENLNKSGFTCIELDANDEHVYASGSDGIIHRFSSDLKPISQFVGHTQSVNELVIAPNNTDLFSTSADGTLRIWNIETSQGKVLFKDETDLLCVDLTSDGKFLAVSGNNGVITVGELVNDETGFKVVKSIQAPESILTLEFSAVHHFLVTGDKNGAVVVYDFETWGIIRKFNHGGPINGMSVSKAENLIVTGGTDSVLKVWDMKGKHEEYELKAHLAAIRDCIITKDQRSIISGSYDGFVIIWRMPVFESETRWKTHTFEPISTWFSKSKYRLETIGLTEQGITTVWWDNLGNMFPLFTLSKPRKPEILIHLDNELILFYTFHRKEEEESLFKEISEEDDEYMVIDFYNLTENCKKKTSLIQARAKVAYISIDSGLCFTGEIYRIKVWKYPNFDLVCEIPSQNGMLLEIQYDPIGKSLFTCDSTAEIKHFSMAELNLPEPNVVEVNSIQHNPARENYCKMLISKDRQFLFVVLEKSFKIIEIRNFQEIKTIESSYLGLRFSGKQTLLVYSGTEIDVYSQEDFSLLANYRKRLLIEKLIVTPDDEEFIIVHKNVFLRQPNPIMSKTIRLVGAKSEEFDIVKHIYFVIKKMCNTPYSGSPFLIEPLHINILHIYAQRNMAELLRQGIEAGIPYLPSFDGWTPLSISLKANYTECVKMNVKGLTNRLSESLNPCDTLVYKNLEHDLVKLNNFGFYNLHKLYESLFIEDTNLLNPNLAAVDIPLPQICYSDYNFVSCTELGISKEPPERTNAINYNKSLVRFSMILGSRQSLDFLDSIKNCSNKEIFRTPLIQLILDEKWSMARRLMVYQAVAYIFYLISLVVYAVGPEWFIWVPLSISLFLYIYEIIFIYIDPRNYFKSFWNLIDTTRAAVLLIYFFTFDEQTNMNGLLAFLIAISWFRGITYFRINSKSRYLINLLFQVLSDIVPFMVIFMYTTLGFGVIQGMLTNTYHAPFKNFIDSYLISNGIWNNFRYEDPIMNSKDFVYPLAIIMITLINPVVVVNLLVSILSDTYETVEENAVVADGLELVDMIIEIETLHFWNRDKNEKKYLHTSTLNIIQDDADDLEVEDLVRKVKEKFELIRTEIDEKSKSFQGFLNKNSEMTQLVTDGLNRLWLKINN